MSETWPHRADLVALLANGHPTPNTADKLRFGLDVMRRQLTDRPDWIFYSHLGLARVAALTPQIWRAPYAVFLHGIEVWKPLDRGDVAILQGAALRIANSVFTANAALAANPTLGRIDVCPLALPRTTDAPPPGRTNDDGRTVLVVGRLAAAERYKGHEQLIKAWPAVLSRLPGARLVVVGDGDDRARLQTLASGGEAGAAIDFTGFLDREALNRHYEAAALFALPSRGEGFGLVYLEAMAHGVPCLGSTQDAAGEVIVDGRTGVLVDPDDVAALSREITALLESPARRRALGEAGRARAADQFSYDRFRTQIVTLLRGAFPESLEV
jgi:phosphatidylinositol alpha-1,6-mannosyltransferase